MTKENLLNLGFLYDEEFDEFDKNGFSVYLFKDGTVVSENNRKFETEEDVKLAYEVWRKREIHNLSNIINQLTNKLEKLRYGI